MDGWQLHLDQVVPEPHFVAPRFQLVDIGGGETLRLLFDQLLERVATGGERTTWVRGPGGAGKTTFVRHAARSWLQRRNRRGRAEVVAPAWVSFRSLSLLPRSFDSPLDLARMLRPDNVDEKPWRSAIDHGRVVFVVDAMNEIERLAGIDRSAREVSRILQRLVYMPARLPVLVTSRVEPDSGPRQECFHRIDSVELEPFGDEQIRAYLSARGLDPVQACAEIDSLGLRGGVANPYLLRQVCDYLENRSRYSKVAPPRSRIAVLRLPAIEARTEHRLAGREQALAAKGLDLDAALAAASLVTLAGAPTPAARLEDLLAAVWDQTDAQLMTDVFLDTHQAVRHGDDGFTLQHESLVDAGLAIPFRDAELPLFTAAPGLVEQFAGDWVGIQADPDAGALVAARRLAAYHRHDLIVDVVVANRGVLREATRRELWRTAGLGLVARRVTRDRTATALGRLGRETALDASRGGVFHAAVRGDREALIRYTLLLRTGRFTAHAYHKIQRERHYSPTNEVAEEARRKRRSADRGRRDRREPAAGHAGAVEGDGFQRAGNYEPVPVLLGRLGAASIRMRVDAALALGQHTAHDREIARALVDVLRRDSDSRVRRAASRSLGLINVRDRDTIQALADRIVPENEADARVRGESAKALGLIGVANRNVISVLIRAVENDADAKVRGSAATALGLLGVGSKDAIRTLTTALRRDSDPINRGSSATALGLIGVGDRSAVAALCITLRSDSDTVNRGSAATALGHIGLGLGAAVKVLIRAVSDEDESADVRGSAANALGLIGVGDRRAIRTLVDALDGRDGVVAPRDVRASSANALGLIGVGDPAAIAALVRAVNNPDEPSDIRGSAANALGLIGVGDEEATRVLRDALAKAGEPDVRGACANALGLIGLGDAHATAALTGALGDPDARVRASAALALGLIGVRGAVAIDPLVGVLETDVDERARCAAADALGLIGVGDEHAVETLSRAIARTEESVRVRASSAYSLGLIAAGSQPAIGTLADTLVDVTAPARVRASAANALALIGSGDDRAVQVLIQVVSDPDPAIQPSVRGAATNALGYVGVGNPDVTKLLVKTATDRSAHVDVRNVCIDTLIRLGVDPHPWATTLYREPVRHKGVQDSVRWFRGKIVALVASGPSHAEHVALLDQVARVDRDRKSRTCAVQGLARWNRLSDDLLAYLIDPDYARPDGRKRDTDNGVCGEVARAVLRKFRDGATPREYELTLVLRMLTDPATYSSVISSATTPLSDMTPGDRQRALQCIRSHPSFTGEVHPVFRAALGRLEEQTQIEVAAGEEFRRLIADPASILRRLAKHAHAARSRVAADLLAPHPFVFRPRGGQYEVRFGEEYGYLPAHDGVRSIYMLLHHPNASLSAEQIQQLDPLGGRSGVLTEQRIHDGSSAKRVREELEQVQAELSFARASGDAQRAAELAEQEAMLRGEHEAAEHGQSLPNEDSALVRNTRKNIRTSLKLIGQLPGLERLAHHLNSNVHTNGFRYAPGPDVLPWELS